MTLPDHQSLPEPVLPVIDLRPYFEGTDKHAVARDIHAACTGTGFFYLTGHGIPEALIEDVFDLMRTYFALPEEEKLKVDARHSPAFRGYFPLHGERLDPAFLPDLKEGFDMGRHVPEVHIGVEEGWPNHAPNRFPADPSDFQARAQAYYDRMNGLGQSLMRIFALSLDLPETWFDESVDHPFSILRMLHYPPQPVTATTDAMGCGAHTDYGCFTILANDKNGGLEIQLVDGNWVHVPPREGCFVVNISDMMQRWTNDRYKSTVHRVKNVTGADRYSIPFFFDPNYNAVVECLPNCRESGRAPKYESIRAGDYLLKRLADAF